MRYRFDQKDEYVLSAELETIKEIKELSIPKKIGELLNYTIWQPVELNVTPIELAGAIIDGSIKKWPLFRAVFSRKIGQYMSGKPIPKIKRVGSTFIPIPARKPFGTIRDKDGEVVSPKYFPKVEK